jgi:hypothetical protein
MATLKKMTRIGADVRQIARLLQQKAPENHMLAYITPEEAQFLKDRGGSGMPDAETGVPTFAPAYDYNYGFTEDTAYDIGDVRAEPAPPRVFSADAPAASVDYQKYAPVPLADKPVSAFSGEKVYPTFLSLDTSPGGYNRFVEAQGGKPIDTSRGFDGSTKKIDADVTPTVGDRFRDLSKYLGVKEDTLARMGLGGLQAVLGARQARQAREESQKAKEEQQKLAAPYRQQGAELQRQAQAGELTPVGQQQLRTVQAQAAQAASARGGVGAQQTAARVEAIRNQLLQQQSDYGLKLSGIGDQILLGSIRTGLEADRYVNQLATTYYTNIARTLVGAPTVVQYGVTQ